jgi:AcrR family transcriptional regulator
MGTESAIDQDLLLRIRDNLPGRTWESITTAELAEASGLSRMTLHRRGITKDELLVQFGARLEAEYRDALFDALTAPGTARERLRHALLAVCEVNERYLPLLDALAAQMDAVFHQPAPPGQPVLTRPAFAGALRRLLEDGRHDGSIAVVDPEETATLLFNAVDHTYRHMRTGHRWAAPRARERVVALVLNGLPS